MPSHAPATPDSFFQEAFVEYNDASTGSKAIVFDAVLEETWEQGASVTEHPVEQGANVADHVRVVLPKCTLKVRATNAPIGPNQFADPLADGQAPLQLSVKTARQHEFSGIVTVPTWNNNLDAAVQIGIAAGFVSNLAAGLVQKVADATPLGNAFAQALKPVLAVSRTGNELIAYPDLPQVAIGGLPIRSVGDAVGALVSEGITSLVPGGLEIDLPFVTNAGLPGGLGLPRSVTAKTVQFEGVFDFAAEMISLLVDLKDKAQLFTVHGSKQTETSMVIETLTVHRGAPEDTGSGADITVGFKKIRIVSTNTVAAPLPKVPRGEPPIEMGEQDPVDDDPADIKSVALGGLEGVANHFSGAP